MENARRTTETRAKTIASGSHKTSTIPTSQNISEAKMSDPQNIKSLPHVAVSAGHLTEKGFNVEDLVVMGVIYSHQSGVLMVAESFDKIMEDIMAAHDWGQGAITGGRSNT